MSLAVGRSRLGRREERNLAQQSARCGRATRRRSRPRQSTTGTRSSSAGVLGSDRTRSPYAAAAWSSRRRATRRPQRVVESGRAATARSATPAASTVRRSGSVHAPPPAPTSGRGHRRVGGVDRQRPGHRRTHADRALRPADRAATRHRAAADESCTIHRSAVDEQPIVVGSARQLAALCHRRQSRSRPASATSAAVTASISTQASADQRDRGRLVPQRQHDLGVKAVGGVGGVDGERQAQHRNRVAATGNLVAQFGDRATRLRVRARATNAPPRCASDRRLVGHRHDGREPDAEPANRISRVVALRRRPQR